MFTLLEIFMFLGNHGPWSLQESSEWTAKESKDCKIHAGIWGPVFSMLIFILMFDMLILSFIYDFSTDQRPLLGCNNWDIGLSAMSWRVPCLRGQVMDVNRNNSSEADSLSHWPVVVSLVCIQSSSFISNWPKSLKITCLPFSFSPYYCSTVWSV